METEIKYIINKQNRIIQLLKTFNESVNLSSSQSTIHDLYDDFRNAQTNLESHAKEYPKIIDYDILSELQAEFDAVYFKLLSNTKTNVEVKPTGIAQQQINFKLPRLTIKPFNGDFIDWINFKALYEVSVHNSNCFSDSQKLQILRSHLHGDALALIDTLPISDANYVHSYKLLCDRYDNIRSSANFHFSRLFNHKVVHPSQEAFRELLSVLHSGINALKSLNLDLQNFLLLQLVLNTLPDETRRKFDESCDPNRIPTVEDALNFITRLEKSYENSKYNTPANSIARSGSPDNTPNFHSQPKQNFTRKTTSLVVENQTFKTAKANANPRSHNFWCVYCTSENHNIFTCTDFLLLSIEDRQNQILQRKLCFNCLGRHQLSACKSFSTCRICHSRHHTLLHQYTNISQSNVGLVTSERHYSPLGSTNAPQPYSYAPSMSTLPPSASVITEPRSMLMPSVTPVAINSQLFMPQLPCTQNSSMHVVPAPVYNATPVVHNMTDSNVYRTSAPVVPHLPTSTVTHASTMSAVNQAQPITTASHAKIETNNFSPDQVINNLSCKVGNQAVLLGTAIVEVLDPQGHRHKLRAVLDCGSETTIITFRAAQKLGLQLQQTVNQICGISSSVTQVHGQVQLQLRSSITPNFHATCDALVVSNIVGKLPSSCLPDSLLEQFHNQDLADPNFIHASRVDVLLGADIYPELIVSSANNLISGSPAALRTVFGLIILGKIPKHDSVNNAIHTHSLLSTMDPVHKSLQKFWEIEEVQLPKVAHPDDILCEKLFQATTSRDPTGRYVVSLPFKPGNKPLCNNTNIALKNYQRFQKRLSSQPVTEAKYHDFMQEYIDMNHMSIAASPAPYIIPHHCVMKETSSTTKLRTVFNASYPDGSGNSLNAQLLPGPKLQQDICNVLISFRAHKFVICADIKMMYRQILIRPEDRIHQHIFYQPRSQEAVQEFELNTVTYGITSSAYLAQRVLIQLTEDEGNQFPLAMHAIRNHTYVDDVLTGADTIQDARALTRQLIGLFDLGGLSLRKWSSNEPSLLTSFPDDHLENPLSFTDDSPSIKILGLQWTPNTDSFSYRVTPFESAPTKRTILSYISRMFDPLGLLAPITFWAKFFIQKLWQSKLDWDDNLPTHLATLWNEFAAQLPSVSCVNISRFFGASGSDTQLIGFCDASEKGYAAVLYLCTSSNSYARVTLLKSKTRVAPVKTMTIPRLELCAALLLAKLYESVIDSFVAFPNLQIYLFSDAQIVLTWLKTPPHLLKTFISNRVQQILAIAPLSLWRHISTHLNPADVASRGASPQALIDHHLWWTGPDFLLQPVETWPSMSDSAIEEIPELRQEKSIFLQTQSVNSFVDIFCKQSSYLRILRIMAYVQRFICHARKLKLKSPSISLTVPEIQAAKRVCLTIIQDFHFHTDIQSVKQGKPPSRSIQPLTPVIDPDSGLLRAGGRLTNSALPPNAKQPIILPKKSHFTTLICQHFHKLALHAGPRTTQSIINQEFWIPGLRSLLRLLIHHCTRCIRYRHKPVAPLMASLPASRVSSLRPFQAVGIDFAGPFAIKLNALRKSPSTKGYLSVFVCMCTKAVHLECVSDLSTEAFLAAFDRFVSRRGLPSDVYSDNGTNFAGASTNIQEVYDMLKTNQNEIITNLASRAIKWHFNPPYAPNFGGLWEAAVKSAKHHLHRVMHNRSLTFEELTTLLTRIEAVLNSRPLFEPSPDPTESHLTLTPGHFLIGTSLLQPPEEIVDSQVSLRSRWTLLRQLFQSFWRTWSQHYLHSVIQRYKWYKPQPNYQVDQIVIIYGSPTSPSEWPLARITDVHPSKDGVVRVVTLRTAHGTYTRSANKLIPVPTGTVF